MPRFAAYLILVMCAWDLLRTRERQSALQEAVLKAWASCTTSDCRYQNLVLIDAAAPVAWLVTNVHALSRMLALRD